ncbi:MAG: GDSL-type esterase/lipase family protein [Ferruginibacter sp.]
MHYSYLALGDSYTIGEQVLPQDNFPNQTVALLNGLLTSPDIIATTGFTTDELNTAIDAANIAAQYDIVSLLIGVNNQYRGRDSLNFTKEFEGLLQRAIHFAGNRPHRVFVLSIPDWGVTAFAADRDIEKIAAEIDAYNTVCENSAKQNGAHFINNTASQRADAAATDFLAPDQLHPSAKEYAKWAAQLAAAIKIELNK